MRSIRTPIGQGLLGVLLAGSAIANSPGQTRTLRIVTYNLEDDTNGATTPRPGLITPSGGGTVQQGGVLEGIGEQVLGSDPAQPIDILALQETTSNAATVTPIADGLNAFYNTPGRYAMSPYQATSSGGITSGGGPSGLIYNTATLQLLASVPVDPPGGISQLGSSSGEYREVIRYQFAPAGVTATPANEFYIYVSHYKASTGAANEAARAGEARIIRNDEASHLRADARVLYIGDYNATSSGEPGYQTILAPAAPNGAPQGQGFDPLNPTGATNINWSSSTTSASILSMETESGSGLRYRDDLQLMTSNVFYGVPGGLALVPGTYHTFGNNGTISYGARVTSASNTALTNLAPGSAIGAATLYRDLTNASDHLPVVADYTIPVLTAFQQWQMFYFGSTTNPGAAPDADADGTGQNNQFKYVAGLNPTNPSSVFAFTVANVAGQPTWKDLMFSPAVAGRTYRPDCRTNLVNASWTPLLTFASAWVTNGSQVTVTDTNTVSPLELYRIGISFP